VRGLGSAVVVAVVEVLDDGLARVETPTVGDVVKKSSRSSGVVAASS